MKIKLLPASVAFGCLIALLSSLARTSSFNAPDLLTVVGGMLAAGVLLLALSDYTRQPRLRLPMERKSAGKPKIPALSPAADPSYDWTYVTRSA